MDISSVEVDEPHSEEEKSGNKEVYTHVYAHFTRSEEDAREIARTEKLRTSSVHGRRDRVFAVDLDETVHDPVVQYGSRVWGVVFTTPEQGFEGENPREVYWYPPEKDNKGGYIPLDMVFVVGPGEKISAYEVRDLLRGESSRYDDNDPEVKYIRGEK